MNSNINDYLHACTGCCYDFIALTETWLDDRTLSSNLVGNDFEVFRCDRGPENSTKKSGGGVLIAVRRALKAHRVVNAAWDILEQVWVSAKVADHNIFVCVVYLPPDRTRDKSLIEAHLQSVSWITVKAKPRDEIVVLGDFNLPNIQWTPSRDGFLYPDPDHSSFHTCSLDLIDGYNAANLQQINSNANENGRCLDLCFVSSSDVAPRLIVAPAPLVKRVPHHPALMLTLDSHLPTEFLETSDELQHNFQQADYEGLSTALQNLDWMNLLDLNDVDLAVNEFTRIIQELIDRFVPRASPPSNEHLPWQSSALLRMKSTKNAVLRRYSAYSSSTNTSPTVALSLRNHYRRVNYAYKSSSRRCYSAHRRRIEGKLRSDPKKFWKFVNDQRKESGLPTTMMLNDEVANDTATICQYFARKFSSIFSEEELDPSQVREAAANVPASGISISNIDIDERTILAAAAKLKHSTSSGPDGIPATLLKKCIQDLLTPLIHIFRLSLNSGRFPNAWKQAYMFPVHKKGDRIDNYRGISSLSATSKLFELAVIGPVFSNCQQSLVDEQHGFLPKRSTATNLLCFTGYVLDSFSERSQTDAIYTDLSAAFDKVNHEIAIAKLDRLGIRGNLLNWFGSYLTGRTIRVKIRNEVSLSFPATSGIAQGSHIGPLVFLFYFNDANYSLEGPHLVFADDLKLFSRIDSPNDAFSLQQQLNNFAGWCDLNRMTLNPRKCSVITFTRKLQPLLFNYRLGEAQIPRVEHIKDLGVILDPELNFKQHVSYVVAQASRKLGLIIRMTREFRNIQCLETLYCSLVRSTLEYCSTVWSPHYNNAVHRIESIQRRFVRFALRLLPWRQPMRLTPYEDRCQLLHLDTLELRRETARAMTVSDLLTSRIDCPELLRQINIRAPSRSIRRAPALHLPFRRTNYGARSAIIGLQRAFNRVAAVFDFHLPRVVIRSNFISTFRRLFYH